MKRKPTDSHPLGLTCDECTSPLWARSKCSKHYAAMKMATGQRKRYSFLCVVCHCPGESFDAKSRMHPACQRRTTRKSLLMSRSTEIALWQNPKYKERPVKVLPKGQIMFQGICWNCGAQWASYKLRHSCSDECSAILKKAKAMRNGGGHRKRAKHYGGVWNPGITALSVFQESRWICQICLGPVDPRESTGLWMPTLDHIIPMARGGDHSRENLQLAHMICNAYKRDL